MKKTIFIILVLFLLLSCKSLFKGSETGDFLILNYSDKTIEFIWIAPEGEFFPTVKSVNVNNNDQYEFKDLEVGIYDIAIDFKDEYNSFNSKKDKSLCLKVKKGETSIWTVEPTGKISKE